MNCSLWVIYRKVPLNAERKVPVELKQKMELSLKNPTGFSEKSLEETFGLGDDQLRELMEQELPVPREDLVTGKELKEDKVDKNKVLNLPDLSTFMTEKTGSKMDQKLREEAEKPQKKVDRSNVEEYDRVLQLNPFADADDELFLAEYDIIPSIFGTGKLLGIPIPFLQSGHGMLLLVTCLAAFVYAPGNPLTEFPPEIRSFLRQGLGVAYSINFVLAIQAFFIAKSKNLPGLFWGAKCFVLGGVAFYEVNQARDPSMLNSKDSPSDRKSKTRDKSVPVGSRFRDSFIDKK